jgi:hypothetical protein
MSGLARVREAVGGWWWPLGWVAVVAPAVVIAVVVVVLTWPMVGWPFPLWVQTSAQFHQQFTWPGLVAGTGACWHAVRFHRGPRIRGRLDTSDRDASGSDVSGSGTVGASVVGRHLRVLVSWWVGAYVVGLVPLVVATAVAGGVGAPDGLVMVSGVLAMVAAVVVGYAVGTVVPSWVAVGVTAVGFGGLLVAGWVGGDEYVVLAPVLYLEPVLGQRESPALVVVRIAVFVAVAMASGGLAARCARRIGAGERRWWRRVADVVVHGAAPVVLIVATVVARPAMFVVDERPAAVCEVRREIRYCVNLAHQPRLGALIASVDPVIARYGTAPGVATQVWDQSLAFGPIDIEVARTLQIAFLNPDGSIDTDLPGVLAGIYSCPPGTPSGQNDVATAPRGGHADQAKRLAEARRDIQRFLLERDKPPAGVFAGMSVPEVERWLAEHHQQLHTCTLTPDQLPQS